jgi:hypothetical protein
MAAAGSFVAGRRFEPYLAGQYPLDYVRTLLPKNQQMIARNRAPLCWDNKKVDIRCQVSDSILLVFQGAVRLHRGKFRWKRNKFS